MGEVYQAHDSKLGRDAGNVLVNRFFFVRDWFEGLKQRAPAGTK